MFTPEQKAALEAPLNKANVKKNPKGFDYVEGWHAIAEANRIFGHDGWTRELLSLVMVAEPYKVGDNWRVGYRATVRITVGDVVRDGTGYGSGIVRDLNDAHEGAVKEAETDAMKRALMTFGNPFGLALYDKTQANVVAEPPPISGACLMACDLLKASKTAEELKAFWNMNKDGLKRDLDPHEYAQVVTAMQAEAKRLAPKVKAPAAEEKNDFGIGADNVPEFA